MFDRKAVLASLAAAARSAFSFNCISRAIRDFLIEYHKIMLKIETTNIEVITVNISKFLSRLNDDVALNADRLSQPLATGTL